MRIKNVFMVLLAIALVFGIAAFGAGCNPPKEKKLSDIKAEDLSKITLTRRAGEGVTAKEKDLTDTEQMQALLDVINSVEYTQGEARMAEVKGKYRIVLIYKNNKGKAVEVLSETKIFMDKHYYEAQGSVDLSQYDEFLD